MSQPRNFVLLTAFLGALSALAPWSIDMSLPALTAIEAGFEGAAGRGPLTLSFFLAGFAIAPLAAGPLADRFGRRPVLLIGVTLYTLAALGAAAAPNFAALLGLRVLQGLAGGSCVVLPLAIVRDLCDPATARLQLSRIFAILNVVPIAVPMLGAGAMALAGWRSVYLVQALGGLALAASALGVKESLPRENRRSLRPARVFGSYRSVVSDVSFLGYATIFAFGFATMFSFIAGAPAVLMDVLKVSRGEFAVLYASVAGCVLIGALLSASLSRRLSSRRVIGLGLGLMIAATASLVMLDRLGLIGLATLMPLVAMVNIAFGLIGPSANHEAMRDMAEVAGAAAGVLRCLQMLLGAVAGAAIAALRPLDQPVATTAALMLAMALCAGATFVALRRRDGRRVARATSS